MLLIRVELRTTLQLFPECLLTSLRIRGSRILQCWTCFVWKQDLSPLALGRKSTAEQHASYWHQQLVSGRCASCPLLRQEIRSWEGTLTPFHHRKRNLVTHHVTPPSDTSLSEITRDFIITFLALFYMWLLALFVGDTRHNAVEPLPLVTPPPQLFLASSSHSST